MSESLKGGARAVAGSLESAAGDILDRPDLQAAGAGKQLQGRAQRTLGELEEKAADVGRKVSAAATDARDRARDAYDDAKDRLGTGVARVDPFIRDQPYVALGIAAALGLLAGLVLAGRGSRNPY